MSESKKKLARKPYAKKVSMIPVIRIVNPLDPRQRVNEEIIWSAKKTLDEYFPLQMEPVVVSINGKIVLQDQFSVTYLERTDNIVVCPIPTGGGGGKQILTIIAMIAIAVYAPVLAGSLNAALGTGFAAGSMGMAALQAGIMVAGSMLVNSVLAPPKPSAGSSSNTSATYGVDGAKNTSVEGIPVPICYGEFRMGGNILGLYVVNDGSTQMLYMLMSAGEGRISGIKDVEINGTPIADFHDVEIETRLGLPNQLAIPWFNDTIVAKSKSQKVTTDWFYSTTSTNVDKFRVDMVAQGLCFINTGTGSTGLQSVPLEIQYRSLGNLVWTDLKSSVDIVGWADSLEDWGDTGSQVVVRVPTHSSNLVMSAAQRSTFRQSFDSDVLTPGVYEIRCRRTTPKSTADNVIDEIYLSDINEIQLSVMSYPNTALLGLKIKLTDQLSSMPAVTYINGGKVVSVWGKATPGAISDSWYQTASQNPAWIVWDVLTNRRYGAAMTASRLDFEAFKAWAAYCEEKSLQWNGVIDTEMNVWDACQLVLRVGHAQLVNVGTRYSVVVERASDPVMMFSVANMIEGTYKENWLGTADRANEIDVTFFDKEDKHKSRTIKVYDPASLAAGNKPRSAAITLYGVDNHQTALREGLFQLNMNRYILKTVSFSAPLEAVACSVGDLIYVQNDMTNWAVAGRTEAGSSASVIKLDREVAMEVGKLYKLLVLHDSVKRYTGSVQNVVGDSVFLTGFDGAKTVKRIIINGKDTRVAAEFSQGGGSFGVIVDNVSGVTAGMTYELWDTDVIEEYGVVNNVGTFNSITVQSPMSFAPAQFINWMFGEADKVKALFRVKSVAGTHEYRRDIVAIQYDPLIYDYARYGDMSTVVLNPNASAISSVRNLEVHEETYISGQEVKTKVLAGWQSSQVGYYAGADVYVKINDALIQKVGDANGVTDFLIEAAKGDKVTVKVVAYDVFGKRATYTNAPEATYTVIGEIPNIDVGGVTGVNWYWSGRECKLDWRYNSVTHSYEFGSEPTGGDAGALDPHFKDYEVKVFDATHSVLRRTEYVTSNSYTYGHDKNFADGLTRHLIIEIRMRDKFNNLGVAAVANTYNPAPTITGSNITVSFETATISYTHSNDADFSGCRVYMSKISANIEGDIATKDGFLVYEGPDSSILLSKLMFDSDYYIRIAAYDAFGMTELAPTNVIHFKTTFLNVAAIADGALSSSKLTSDLQTKINTVDLLQVGISNEIAARVSAISAEATARDAAILVEVNARASALIAEATARGAAITTETNARQTANSSLATSVTTLTASNAANAAAISTENTVRTTADSALSGRIDTLVTSTGANTAAITSEQTARTTADSSLSTKIDTLTASTGANTAAIIAEQTTRATADSTEATARLALETAYQAADASTLASAKSYAYSKAQADSAIAVSATSLTTDYKAYADAAKASAISSSHADVVSYSYSKSGADGALATLSTTLTAAFKADDATAKASSDAYLANYAYSKAGADSAISTQTSDLRTTVGAHTTSISQQIGTTDGLKAQYTVKIDNNGYVSGYGLASYPVNGVITSEFIIRADTFGVVMPSYPTVKPFVIGAINGVPRVIISSALIGDASINSAMIGTLAVKSANIDNLTVGTNKITGNAVTEVDEFSGALTSGLSFVVTEPSKVLVVVNYTANYTGQGSNGSASVGIAGIPSSSASVTVAFASGRSGTLTSSASLNPGTYSLTWGGAYETDMAVSRVFILKVKR